MQPILVNWRKALLGWPQASADYARKTEEWDGWAEARIDGATVLVSSAAVPHPIAVRYAWQDNPQASLYNREGLPASPFRTDDWSELNRPR